MPVRGFPQEGQLPAFRASEDVPPRAYPPPVEGGLPDALAQRAARVNVETRPGVAVPGPGTPGEDTRVFPEGGVLLRVEGPPGLPEGSLLINALFGPSEIASPGRQPLPAVQGKGLVEVATERLDVTHVLGFRCLVPKAGVGGVPPHLPDLGNDERDRAPGLSWG